MNKDTKQKVPMSNARANALQRAQFARRMSRTSPRTTGQERTKKAIDWVYRFGYTSPTTLEMALKSFRSGIGNRLVKSGLLIKTETPSGGINNTPAFLLTLSQKGLDYAIESTDILLPYEINPEKINHALVNHSEKVQRLTAYMLNNDDIFGFKTEKELIAESNNKDEKQPDIFWELSCNFTEPGKHDDDDYFPTAVEVELTPKWNRELDRFVYMSLSSLSDGKFSRIRIYSRSKALLVRYKEHFAAGKEKLQTWEKQPGKTGRWLKKSKISITHDFDNQVSFHLIEDKMLIHHSGNPFFRGPSSLEGLEPPDLD